MITVRVYDDYNFIALQDLDTSDLEGFEFSTKFTAKTIGDMEKLMACVGHYNYSNFSKIQLLFLYKAL